MKTLKAMLAACVLGLATLLAAPAAHAGGWAATVLDPLPERIEADRTYTFGYWVLQHASHPYDGDFGKLGRTALKIVGEDGKSYTFEGVPLGQTSHYAAAVSVPRPGTWELYALQGIFEKYKIGTLTVPGGVQARPLPTPRCSQQHEPDWGLIHPPERDRCNDDGSARSAVSDGQPDGQDGNADRQDGVAASDAGGSGGSGTASAASSLPIEALWALLALPLVAGGLLLARRWPALAARWRSGSGSREAS